MSDEDALLMWQAVLEFLAKLENALPTTWPPELPPLGTPGFWWEAARLEMTTRDSVSAALRLPGAGAALRAISPLGGWMVRRRIEWAAQIVQDRIEERAPTGPTPEETLEWLLIESWESDGCLAFWSNAERDGKPPRGLGTDEDAR